MQCSGCARWKTSETRREKDEKRDKTEKRKGTEMLMIVEDEHEEMPVKQVST